MKSIIFGGAGFIGANAAARHLEAGDEVVVVDNLMRDGSRKNLRYLQSLGGKLRLETVDIRDRAAVESVVERHRDADRILHLAAQVAVTTSVVDPRTDFEINVLGSLNILEAMRRFEISAPVLYSSTNKVYGEMTQLGVELQGDRYGYADLPHGISEERNLDFHSPYGCSKGSADQYFIDYHRIYGLNTIVFRQSCIYGPRQFGAEDQGWIAWFMIASLMGHPVTIFGDGKQARDILFVYDLLDAYDAAFENIQRSAGRVYNVGGGPDNVLSLIQLVEFISERRGVPLPYAVADWRPGDQKIFVSDIRRAEHELQWAPKTSCQEGLASLYNWLTAHRELFEDHSARLKVPAADFVNS